MLIPFQPPPPFKQVKLMKSKVTNENWVWFVCYQFQLQLAYYAYAVFAWGCEKAKAKAKGVINFNKNCSKVSCLRLKRGRWEKGGLCHKKSIARKLVILFGQMQRTLSLSLSLSLAISIFLWCCPAGKQIAISSSTRSSTQTTPHSTHTPHTLHTPQQQQQLR